MSAAPPPPRAPRVMSDFADDDLARTHHHCTSILHFADIHRATAVPAPDSTPPGLLPRCQHSHYNTRIFDNVLAQQVPGDPAVACILVPRVPSESECLDSLAGAQRAR